MDMASHRLDLMCFLFGKAVSVSALAHTRLLPIDVEDTGSLLLEFQGGIHALLFASHVAVNPRDDFEILGSSGQLRVCPFNDGELVVTTNETQVYHLPKPDNVHLPLVEDFNESIRLDREPMINGNEGLKASCLLEAAYLSAREKRVISSAALLDMEC